MTDYERGEDRWSHLHSHGHRHSTVRSCVKRGWLQEPLAYHYEITAKGIQAVYQSP
jgi:hypothetical protein